MSNCINQKEELCELEMKWMELISIISRIDVGAAKLKWIVEENENAFSDMQRASIGSFYAWYRNSQNRNQYAENQDAIVKNQGIPKVLYNILEMPKYYHFTSEGIFSMYECMSGYVQGSLLWGREDIRNKLDKLCQKYQEHKKEKNKHSILLLSKFLYEFICIRPFEQYNAEMLEILAQYLLDLNGYIFVRYIQNEREELKNLTVDVQNFVKESKNENVHNESFYLLKKFLYWIEDAQNETLERIKNYRTDILTKRIQPQKKKERILGIIAASDRPLSKKEITDYLCDVSGVTVGIELGNLCKEGEIERVGSTRLAAYRRVLENREKN